MWNGATWDVLSSACVFTPRRHVTVTLCRVRPMSIGQRGRGEFRLWRSSGPVLLPGDRHPRTPCQVGPESEIQHHLSLSPFRHPRMRLFLAKNLLI
jgi:hypothetical protein